MRTEALRGHVDLLVLATLANEPAHGYRVVELLRERSGSVLHLPEGTIYPALYRLERGGLLASRWVAEKGRRRRIYRVTRQGHRELARQRRDWSAFSAAVEAVLA